ncbi:MAG: segregation/condensation protein A [Pyrinomonadaceae bacterium]|nr:segregation/condensation protein A [Pyrinomonadaceae bacterium]
MPQTVPNIFMDVDSEQLVFDFENVQPHIERESRDQIKLTLGEFAGPLDLLLYLIRQEKANIFDIPIAKITDEYLRYIRLLKSMDITLATDFLVMAATLIEIKSKMLLPRDPVFEGDEEAEDPRQELVDQLLEHEKFKRASEMLYERSTIEQATFSRGLIESDDNNLEINATVFDILKAFQQIMERRKEEIQMEIAREEMSLAEMLKNIRSRIFTSGKITLLEIFEELKTKNEFVLAFIAVLEIVRTESVRVIQEQVFGEITLTRT